MRLLSWQAVCNFCFFFACSYSYSSIEIQQRHARYPVVGVKNRKEKKISESRGFLGWSRPSSWFACRSQSTLQRGWIEELFSGAFSKVSRIGASIRVGASSYFFFVLCFDFSTAAASPMLPSSPSLCVFVFGFLDIKIEYGLVLYRPTVLKVCRIWGKVHEDPLNFTWVGLEWCMGACVEVVGCLWIIQHTGMVLKPQISNG